MMGKAMSSSLNVVVALVVLLVVALVLVTLVTRNVGSFSGSAEESTTKSSEGVQCQVEIAAYCTTHESGDSCADCPSCSAGTTCP